MATITTRSGKGSPLTNSEVDGNFTNLNTDKIELTDLSVGAEATPSGDGAIAYNNTTGVFTYTPPESVSDITGAVVFAAKAGEALSKGDAVYVSGVSGSLPVVSKADADDSAKMPAYGLAETTVNANASVNVVTFGSINDVDTSAYSAGDTLYISTTAGSLTATKPTGESSLIQNIGRVIRSHASAGSIKVGGAGRTNDTPNLNNGNVFIGNSSNQAETRALVEADISDFGTYLTSVTFSDIDGGAVLLSTETFADVDTQLMTAAAIDDRIESKGYITTYTVTQSDVTAHQAALSITESQISDFGSYLANLSEDTSPQLGANLDLNGYDIVTTSNGSIDLDPHGSGVVVFKGNSTRGAGQFKLNCEANSHGITIKGPPHSAGASYTLTLPNDDGSADQVLKTDGSGNLSWVAQTTAYGDADVDTHLNTSGASSNQVLSWTGSDYSWVTQSGGGGGLSDVVSDTTPQLGGNLDVNGNSIVSVSNGNIPITPDGTGKIVLDGLSWPTSDGSANQVLQTDGAGQLSFVAQSGGGGGASVTTSDTAPSSPSDGDLWYDTTTLRLYVYYNDGSSSQWVKANPSGSRDSNTSVAIQETAPSNPSSGDMWFDPNALKTYIYYNDGDSNQWVQANPTGGGGSGSGGASNSNIIALNMFFGG